MARSSIRSHGFGATRSLLLGVCTAVIAGACADSITSAPTTSPSPVESSVVNSTADTPTDPIAGTTAAPTPATAVPSSSSSPPPTSVAEPSCVEALTPAELAALVVWPAAISSAWDQAVAVVRDVGVGGVLLMEPQGWSEAELRQNLAELDAASARGIVVATDEEGGTVQRLRAYRDLPSQSEISETMSPADAQTTIAEHGRFVADLGIDVVLGPVVDVLPADAPPPLGRSRFFDGDAAAVAAYGEAYVRGWAASGLVPTLKHFPGHGRASGDTHDVRATTPDLESLAAADLVPYRRLVDLAPAVMVGHLIVPGLTGDVPASLSPAAVEYLRRELGYGDALVISDALGMSAVPNDLPDAAVLALVAGVDVVLFTNTARTAEVVDRIVAAVDSGELAPERLAAAAGRVARLLPGGGCDD